MNTLTGSTTKRVREELPPVVEQKGTEIPAPKVWITPTGGKITIREAFGRDAITASRLADGDQSLFIPGLMAGICLCDGQKRPMEWYMDLPLSTYLSIAAEVGGAFI